MVYFLAVVEQFFRPQFRSSWRKESAEEGDSLDGHVIVQVFNEAEEHLGFAQQLARLATESIFLLRNRPPKVVEVVRQKLQKPVSVRNHHLDVALLVDHLRLIHGDGPVAGGAVDHLGLDPRTTARFFVHHRLWLGASERLIDLRVFLCYLLFASTSFGATRSLLIYDSVEETQVRLGQRFGRIRNHWLRAPRRASLLQAAGDAFVPL